jgi:death on curing protein
VASHPAVLYLDLVDVLVIAEIVLDTDAQTLASISDLGLIDAAVHAPQAGFGEVEVFPDLHSKAAVLFSRLQGHQPLPDGNKRVAYAAMREFLERNGWSLTGTLDERFEALMAVAERTMTEEAFAGWLRANTDQL